MKTNLIYSSNQEIMENYGQTYGWSEFQKKLVKIEHPLTSFDLFEQNKNMLFVDEAGRGFRLTANEIFERSNHYVVVTPNNVYVFEKRGNDER